MLLVSQVDLIDSAKNEVLACFVIAVTQLVLGVQFHSLHCVESMKRRTWLRKS